MTLERLKHPPLGEVVLDLRWKVAQPTQVPPVAASGFVQISAPPMETIDPSYELLVGRLSARLKDTYPSYERLVPAGFPTAFVPFLVQHRFRTRENGWPIVQIGPGVVTLNDTENYSWGDFSRRAVELIGALFEVHPQKSDMKFESLQLRYIDAEPFDYMSEDSLDFLNEFLKVRLALPGALFQVGEVKRQPTSLNVQVGYPAQQPKGTVLFQVATGTKNNQKALIWNTMVTSHRDEVPGLPENLEDWLAKAHTITHHWFFKLIDGALLRKYTGNE